MEDKEIFKILLDRLSIRYSARNIKMLGTIVYVDGEARFNTEGFNLLYNTQRLVNCIKDELI
ncbi:MAG: hypothetical protein [Wendovervirus sonii]|uniref:Uncharacterized protein n=1 Tax=phage Lak_Megaphage_Sonny TaxID=3109229 RepID=A0ABZ0Z5X4_9CAUD|nr:MAG: hypothetical protein [phage Lak_Megaphage_Sonny]